jgi:hypothetical protein
MLTFLKVEKAILIIVILMAAVMLAPPPMAIAFDDGGQMQGGGHMQGDKGDGGPDVMGRPHPKIPRARRALDKGVTPYGDFCPTCTLYGVGREPVGHGKAVAAMRAYFAKKGCTIGNVKGVGRFMKVDVYLHGVLIDRIIFDRRTGRIRSIY